MVRLSVGVVASAGIYAVLLLAPDWWNDAVPTGGFDWRSLLKSTWEYIFAQACVWGFYSEVCSVSLDWPRSSVCSWPSVSAICPDGYPA